LRASNGQSTTLFRRARAKINPTTKTPVHARLNLTVKRRLEDMRELVEVCLRDIRSEADGFPVSPLLHDVLHACQQGPEAREQMMAIVESLLSFWIASLEHDMQAMVPPSPTVLLAIKARMHATQRALIDVRQTLDRLRLWSGAQDESAHDSHPG
jgi:hypothetical protein